MKLDHHWVACVVGIAAASASGCALDTTGELVTTAAGEESPTEGASIDSQEQAASANGAYAWAAGLTFGGVIADFSYSDAGGAITSTRKSQGNYTVTFPGLQAKIPSGVGYPMVTARGTTATRCKPRAWRRHTTSMQVDVRCNNMEGTPWDTDFFVSLYDRSTSMDTGAYATVILSTTTPDIDPPRSWTSGGAMSVIRQAAGLYRVSMPGASRGFEGAAMVSAIDNNSRYCKVHDLVATATDGIVQVACYDTAGTRVDNSFVVDFYSAHGRAPGATAYWHSLSSTGATAPPNNGAYNDWEARVSTARPNAATPFASVNGTGSYTTWFPYIRPFNKTFWHVTANGTDNTFCKPAAVASDGFTPLGTKVDVVCMNPSGTLTNARYFHSMGSNLSLPPL